ncbi:galactokinase [Bacillus sp. ISL-51]|uniref:galactokinase n=1 Tax=Bacteria TaxID=2 RepID=UPI001BE56B25|nr:MULTISPECIES: galactokinase [Bacteria]MBT2573766.1 galactokinase [Bacillus sp. ISL-51]MBT2634903.1 galactokinase [Bacillus sp. ISL-26]MBT2712377.1 galactokinase [Pseudomonas sp. ISL-88]
METKLLKTKFEDVFNRQDGELFFAPGRINLIGEHTDYIGGHVLPCAITLGTYAAGAKREDHQIRLYSENFPDIGMVCFDLHDTAYRKEDNWTNYPKGMIRYLQEAGHKIDSGLDIFFNGNIPNGAGLSSSASIEMLTGVVLRDIFDLDVSDHDLVLTGKKVENEFIGVNSGIMDQFAVQKGKKDMAILLDCEKLEYEMIPVVLDGYKIVIMNTNKRRELAASKYNERRSECEAALLELQQYQKVNSLAQLTVKEFEKLETHLSCETLRKRARHGVSENERTLLAAKALKANDLKTFGELINASHRSLRDDYEVTGAELDILAETAWEEGALGARMTGAGFGGCAIAIVESEKTDSFIRGVSSKYLDNTGHEASFYIADISDGANKWKEK